MLFLSDSDLVTHCQSIGNPLPFSLSSLRKDRIDARLGGLPYRRIGAALLVYDPDEVLAFLAGKLVIQPQRHPALAAAKPARRGKPNKTETVEAARRGITVPELRAQQTIAGCNCG